jgi:hypothetical protein
LLIKEVNKNKEPWEDSNKGLEIDICMERVRK